MSLFYGLYSLEYWCFEVLIISAGLLPNPKLELATLSVWYLLLPNLSFDASFEFSTSNWCIALPRSEQIRYPMSRCNLTFNKTV